MSEVKAARFCAAILAVFFAGELWSATVTSGEGGLTIDVPKGESHTLSAAEAAALAGLDLHKTGEGRLVISTDLKSMGWDGEIVVEAGYLRTHDLERCLGRRDQGNCRQIGRDAGDRGQFHELRKHP